MGQNPKASHRLVIRNFYGDDSPFKLFNHIQVVLVIPRLFFQPCRQVNSGGGNNRPTLFFGVNIHVLGVEGTIRINQILKMEQVVLGQSIVQIRVYP